MTKKCDEPLLTFAAIEWPERWNENADSAAVAAFTERGNDCMLTTCMGFVRFRRAEDGPHLLKQLEAAVELLRDSL